MSMKKEDAIPPRPEGRGFPRILLKRLALLTEGDTVDRVTIGAILEALGPSAFPALILVCAAVNVIPAPPGTSGILGAPLFIVTLQRALGFGLTLPDGVRKRGISRAKYNDLVRRLHPWVNMAERHLHPRWERFVTSRPGTLLDAYLVILSATVLVPLPFTAMLPAFSICLVALGLIARDGLFVISGTLIGAISVAIMLLVLYGVGALFVILVGL